MPSLSFRQLIRRILSRIFWFDLEKLIVENGSVKVIKLSGIGFMLTFAMRCNLGVTLTELTKPKNVTMPKKVWGQKEDFSNVDNSTMEIDENIYNDVVEKVATLDWDQEKVGVVHSSFFWGYIVTQVPSGYLASIFPAYK